MSEKREIISIFSVVTEISTYGGTLKLRDWNNLNHFPDVNDHVDSDYETQMAKNDDNKSGSDSVPETDSVPEIENPIPYPNRFRTRAKGKNIWVRNRFEYGIG